MDLEKGRVIGCLVAGVAIGLVASTVSAVWTTAAMVVFVVVVAMGVSLGIHLLTASHVDMLEPVFLVGVAYLFSYVLRAFGTMLGRVRGAVAITDEMGPLFVVLAGWLSFWLGYTLARGERARPANQPEPVWLDGRLAACLVGACVVSSLCTYSLFVLKDGYSGIRAAMANRRVAFEGLGYLLWGVQLFASVYVVWLLRQVRRVHRLPGARAWVGLGLALTPLVFLGGRAVFVTFALAVLLVLHYEVTAGRNRRVLSLALLMLLFINVYPVWSRQEVDLGFGEAVRAYAGRISTKGAAQLFWDLLGEVPEFDALVAVLQNMPGRLNYQFGRTYLAILTAPLPRLVFANKLPGAAQVFGETLFPEQWQRGTGLRPSALGEQYMNFGLAGVLTGMFLLGTGLRRVYLWFLSNRQSPRVALVYISLASHIPQLIRGEFLGTTVSFVTFLLPALLAISFSTGRAAGGGRVRP